MSTKTVDPRDILAGWAGKDIEIRVRGHDSDAWLARFSGRLMDADGNVVVPGATHDRETWFGLPHTIERAEIDDQGRLALHHADGVLTVQVL